MAKDHFVLDTTFDQCLMNITKAKQVVLGKKPDDFHEKSLAYYQSKLQSLNFNTREILSIDLVLHLFQLKYELDEVEYDFDEPVPWLTVRDIQRLIQLFHTLGDNVSPHTGLFCDHEITTDIMNSILETYQDEMMNVVYSPCASENDKLLQHFSIAAWLCFNLWKQDITQDLALKFKICLTTFSYCTYLLFNEFFPLNFATLEEWNVVCSEADERDDLSRLTEIMMRSTHDYLWQILCAHSASPVTQ